MNDPTHMPFDASCRRIQPHAHDFMRIYHARIASVFTCKARAHTHILAKCNLQEVEKLRRCIFVVAMPLITSYYIHYRRVCIGGKWTERDILHVFFYACIESQLNRTNKFYARH